MIFSISKREIVKYSRLLLKLFIVLIIVFIILTKLFDVLGNIYKYIPKTREEQYNERPLRVISSTTKNT
ncbi:MAG: hypothetical protein H6Q73_1338 [Firmicutes bacterium]|nr:hypothetical protein [Bacillota bacterium]